MISISIIFRAAKQIVFGLRKKGRGSHKMYLLLNLYEKKESFIAKNLIKKKGAAKFAAPFFKFSYV